MKKLLCLAFAVILLVSCTAKKEEGINYTITEDKGGKTFQNKAVAGDKNFDITFEKILTISGDDESRDPESMFALPIKVNQDSEGNIFIMDQKSFAIKKFDSKGNFLKSFGKKGSGPSEYMMAAAGFDMINDKLYVMDGMGRKFVVFDNNGNYLKDISLTSFPVNIMNFTDSTYACYFTEPVMEAGGISLKMKLSVINEDLKELDVISETVVKIDPTDPASMMRAGKDVPIFTSGDSQLFIAEKGVDTYEVKVFGEQKKKLYNIKKAYRRLAYSKEELDQINKATQERIKAAAGGAVDASMFKFDDKFKKVIAELKYDAKGRLWVNAAKDFDANDTSIKYDIFKDGKFINTIAMKSKNADGSFSEIKGLAVISKDKLLCLDIENNKVDVYRITSSLHAVYEI